MAGAQDAEVFEVCRIEERAIVTLDLDFANPLVFDPRETAGVAVFRLSRNPVPSELDDAVAMFLAQVEKRSVIGSLWIVHRDRVRVWKPRPVDSDDT
jgi:predicted nuclease of predicted toxin-antitoxin system